LTVRQLLQGSYAVLAVKDRVEFNQVPEVGQLACIDELARATGFQEGILT